MTKIPVIGLMLAALLLPGCASIISGSTDEIEVATNPPGADCILYRDGANIGRINPTPGKLSVARSYSDITVNCTKLEFDDGATTAGSGFNGWVLGNLVLGGLVGIVIDTATANATGYDDVMVSLLPKQPSAPVALPEAPDRAQGRPDRSCREGLSPMPSRTDGMSERRSRRSVRSTAMTLIVQELRDALVEAGASEERANAAAKAVTSAETAASKEDLRLAVADLSKEMAGLKADLMRAIGIQVGVIIGALSLVFGGIATLIKVL